MHKAVKHAVTKAAAVKAGRRTLILSIFAPTAISLISFGFFAYLTATDPSAIRSWESASGGLSFLQGEKANELQEIQRKMSVFWDGLIEDPAPPDPEYEMHFRRLALRRDAVGCLLVAQVLLCVWMLLKSRDLRRHAALSLGCVVILCGAWVVLLPRLYEFGFTRAVAKHATEFAVLYDTLQNAREEDFPVEAGELGRVDTKLSSGDYLSEKSKGRPANLTLFAHHDWSPPVVRFSVRNSFIREVCVSPVPFKLHTSPPSGISYSVVSTDRGRFAVWVEELE